MGLKINWTQNAAIHLEEILKYWDVRNGSTTYSSKLFRMFQDGVQSLSARPEIGSKTNHELIRKKTIRDYFLYYSFDENEITILGIVDMRRNPKFIKKFEQ